MSMISIHGHAITGQKSRTFEIWQGMIARCGNPSNKHYARYGARGITVCNRWQGTKRGEGFAMFLQDMGEAPEGLSIDRYPDNNGNYEPSNCRWATNKQQQRNKSTNNMLTLNNITMCRTDWEKHLGLSSGAIWHRLQNGWTLERTLTTRRTAA